MIITRDTTTLLQDSVLMGILLALSIFLINFYFSANYLNTNYPDWIVHAFRIKALENDGLASWTHVWSNGISLWKSYQFVPHLITLGVIKLFHLSIPRGMVVMTIGLFILLRFLIYATMRFLHFSPTTAFISAILSFDIAQYWGGVGDFSLLFGFSFFPLIAFLWVKYYQGNIQYLFPYIVGVSFYVHPILGYSSIALWLTAVIFSHRKLLSLPILLQGMIILASSSIFWFPLVFKTSYSYTSLVFANKYFLGLVLSGYKYFGLSIFLLFCLAIAFVRSFMPMKSEYRWSKPFYIFVLLYFALIVVGITIDLPTAIAQLQFTRGAGLVGLAIIYAFAPVIENVTRIQSLALKSLLLFVSSLALIEGIWFTSQYSPAVGKTFSEPITAFMKTYPTNDIANRRVWSADIGLSSYLPPISVRLPYSYMGHLDANQISPRISPLVLYQPYLDQIPQANMARLTDYFKISGVQYALFDENSPFTKTISTQNQTQYKDLGMVHDAGSNYHAFEVLWQPRDAALIDSSLSHGLSHFPFKLELTDVNDQISLDDYVKKFVTVVYDDRNKPLPIAYPKATMLEVAIPSSRQSNLVYIAESFDSNWYAYFNNKPVPLKSVGPNFMLASLPNMSEKGTLLLTHRWPLSFYISVFLIFLIPLEIFVLQMMRKKGVYEKH